ncbi:hypothetical protein B296_00031716 [Ensete ventricosum]|uniref:Uncharacterized protein n=1 Tax=Ensete ventricosum TaxID=4639 RepID=A0A426XTG5_ENSVE|nr:hypothetical protein B296_00031716 [Ensete ventricosum]
MCSPHMPSWTSAITTSFSVCKAPEEWHAKRPSVEPLVHLVVACLNALQASAVVGSLQNVPSAFVLKDVIDPARGLGDVQVWNGSSSYRIDALRQPPSSFANAFLANESTRVFSSHGILLIMKCWKPIDNHRTAARCVVPSGCQTPHDDIDILLNEPLRLQGWVSRPPDIALEVPTTDELLYLITKVVAIFYVTVVIPMELIVLHSVLQLSGTLQMVRRPQQLLLLGLKEDFYLSGV